MNKIVMMLVSALCVFGAQAEDSYMWWMINDTVKLDDATLDFGSGSYSAKVALYQGAPGSSDVTYMSLATVGSNGSLVDVGDSGVSVGALGASFYSALSSEFTGNDWNYYVEIYSADNLIGRSDQSVNYTTAQQAGYIRSANLVPNIYMAVSSFSSPVPEPTSGLLMLIGSAALALRRRKIRV